LNRSSFAVFAGGWRLPEGRSRRGAAGHGSRLRASRAGGTPGRRAAQLLLRVAKTIRERKFEWAAWMVYEVGKNWAEADAMSARPSISANFMRGKRCGGEVGAADSISWRARLSLVHSTRRRRGDSALELPVGNYRGHDHGFHRLRKHGGAEASGDSPAIAAKLVEVLEECGMRMAW